MQRPDFVRQQAVCSAVCSCLPLIKVSQFASSYNFRGLRRARVPCRWRDIACTRGQLAAHVAGLIKICGEGGIPEPAMDQSASRERFEKSR